MYDALMADTPYDSWAGFIHRIFQKHNLGHGRLSSEKPIVLDLACGTGSITLLLDKMGYDMIGVDVSEDMLAEAQQKAYEAAQQILFLAQDARELDLYGTIDGAVSVCDGLNYILSPVELEKVFQRVFLFMNAGGTFIFDLNTEYKFREMLGDKSFEFDVPSGESYIWDNHYDTESRINEYNMLFYTLDGGQESEVFQELHRQRAYPVNEVIMMLEQAGFCLDGVYNDYTDTPAKDDSLRVVFVAVKPHEIRTKIN